MEETAEQGKPTGQKVEALGPTGVRVALRLQEVRRERQLTLSQLADILVDVGRPILLSALSKIEKGQRRVDVDDLVALALALDVPPNQLLLPTDTSLSSTVHLTTSVAMNVPAAWRWASEGAPHLRSQQAARPVVILTALDLEYDAVRRQLTGLQAYRHPSGTVFEIGGTPQVPGSIVLATAGMGNSGAAVMAERAINEFRPKALLFVGIAGALSEDIALGDVVVATKVHAYHGGQSQDDKFSARPNVWQASHYLEQLAHIVDRTGAWSEPGVAPPTVHFQPIAATDLMPNSRIPVPVGDVVAIEMESAGVAQAGQLNQSVPMLTIRGISDRADGGKERVEAASSQSMAAAHAAQFSVNLASMIISEAEPRTS